MLTYILIIAVLFLCLALWLARDKLHYRKYTAQDLLHAEQQARKRAKEEFTQK